jgi:undecaprenyl-diphosphatase
MDYFFIFGAKYAIIISPLLVIWYIYRHRASWRRDLIFILPVLCLTAVLGFIAGHLHYSSRPFILNGVAPLIPHIPNNGFPSDHMLLAAGLAASALYIDRKLAIWLWIMALYVGYSRIYVGVHHFLDIVASVVIALLSSYLVHIVLRRSKSAIITPLN